eukprot:10228271-Lingulodinium_polyedra.AAC.1
MTSWVQPYGPPTCLVVVGESSLASDEAGITLSRQGCTRMLRAPTQHAQMVERKQALLRDQLHKVDTQLRAEELDAPFKYRLAETTLAGNCILTVNGNTPYMALY